MSPIYSRLRLLLLAIFSGFVTGNMQAQPVINFQQVITGLSSSLDLVNAGDGTGRIFVVQQGGTIRVYNSSYTLIGDFLTVTGMSTGGERGLLSMAFDPDYSSTGFFWVYYTNTAGNLEIARYHISGNPNVADAASKQVVLTIPHPVNANHNGGKLNFGADGYLYLGTGDGGSGGDPPNNAQNGNVLLGKMLRINVSRSATAPFYTIPADNPYVSDPAVLDEIWDVGLRNPFRWSFDRLTHDMWIGDVGQDQREEINYRAAGSTGGVNYGWRCYEGNISYNTSGCGPIGNYVFPVYDYTNPPAGSAAVTGGIVYRGTAYPAMYGYYFAADNYSGNLYLINPTNSFSTTVAAGYPGFIAGFGETENGELYAVTLFNGVYRVTTSTVLPLQFTSIGAADEANGVRVRWSIASAQQVSGFTVEYSTDGIHFSTAGTVTAGNSNDYSFLHIIQYNSRIYYRVRATFTSGSPVLSSVVSVDKTFPAFRIYPTVVNNRTLHIETNLPFKSATIYNAGGQVVWQKDISGQRGHIILNMPVLAPGAYFIRAENDTISRTSKFLVD